MTISSNKSKFTQHIVFFYFKTVTQKPSQSSLVRDLTPNLMYSYLGKLQTFSPRQSSWQGNLVTSSLNIFANYLVVTEILMNFS